MLRSFDRDVVTSGGGCREILFVKVSVDDIGVSLALFICFEDLVRRASQASAKRS
jgi:hypothetical protein